MERYSKSIQDDIEKGCVRKLSEEEVCTDSKVTWYLPHGFLINPKKPDRLRRVYDASAKFRGQSLNDKMYTGPDQQALRFLWRESPSEEQSVYQFQRTLLGEVSAPSRAMRRNANEIGEIYLLASKLFTSIFLWTTGYRPLTREKKP